MLISPNINQYYTISCTGCHHSQEYSTFFKNLSPASDPHIITGSHTLSVYSSSCTLYNGEPICSTRLETESI